MKHGMATTGVIGVCLLTACSATPSTSSHSNPSTPSIRVSSPSTHELSTHEPSTTATAAGQVVRTIPFPATDTELFAAYGSALYVVIIPAEPATTLLVERVATGSGATTLVRVPFAQADYLSSIAVGPDGIYLGTSVIKRFTDASDALIRLDLTTLRPIARTSFPAAVRVMARGAQLWASTGDGRELRLDPISLTVQACAQLLPRAAINEGSFVSTPGLGLGSLWVLAGTEPNLRLVRMDPNTLAIRSTTPVPTGGDLAQLLNGIGADANHVYLTGRGLVRVDATGTLTEPPLIGGGLAAVAVQAEGLLAVTDPPTALERLNFDGRVEARLPLADAGGNLSVGGNTAWLLGNAGQGNGIVQVRIEGR